MIAKLTSLLSFQALGHRLGKAARALRQVSLGFEGTDCRQKVFSISRVFAMCFDN